MSFWMNVCIIKRIAQVSTYSTSVKDAHFVFGRVSHKLSDIAKLSTVLNKSPISHKIFPHKRVLQWIFVFTAGKLTRTIKYGYVHAHHSSDAFSVVGGFICLYTHDWLWLCMRSCKWMQMLNKYHIMKSMWICYICMNRWKHTSHVGESSKSNSFLLLLPIIGKCSIFLYSFRI